MDVSKQILDNFERFPPQHANQFRVVLGIPSYNGRITQYTFSPDITSFGLPQGFSTPERGFETIDWSYYGVKRKVPIRREYGQFSMTFLLEEYMGIAAWIEYWMDILIDPYHDFIESYSDIISNGFVEFQPMTKKGTNIAQYKFLEAYPVKVLPINYNMAERNSLVNYQVLFNYKEYVFNNPAYKTTSRSSSLARNQ